MTQATNSTNALSINDLTEEQLDLICDKYGLRKQRNKREGAYHQVLRAKAIRTASKDFASEKQVPQKAIDVVGTHKLGQQESLWKFNVELKHDKEHRSYEVIVDASNEDATIVK